MPAACQLKSERRRADMQYAILSDVHGYRHKLEAVLADAHRRNAGCFVSLGDVGSNGCLALLHQAGAAAVFGNYEVSGWTHLAPRDRAWVQSWPPLLAEDDFLAVHAAPCWPAGLASVQDFGAWLRKTGQSWQTLFPYLKENEGHMWQALAELETAGKKVLFHGHTHRQAIWQQEPAGHLKPLRTTAVQLQAGYHYLVGVGSVGLPEDGGWATYTLYEARAGRIEQIRLDAGPAR
jgi:predicted phosphodiesterase